MGALPARRRPFLSQQATSGMVHRKNKRCGPHDCSKLPSRGEERVSKRRRSIVICGERNKDGMVNVVTRCAEQGCIRWPNYGKGGTKNDRVLLSAHQRRHDERRKKKRMWLRRLRHKVRKLRQKEGTKTAEFCSRHAQDGMVDAISMECAPRRDAP